MSYWLQKLYLLANKTRTFSSSGFLVRKYYLLLSLIIHIDHKCTNEVIYLVGPCFRTPISLVTFHFTDISLNQRLSKCISYVFCAIGEKLLLIPALWRAIYPNAQAAASFTPGSNSSKHMTNASRAPQSTTDCASCGECFATARSTKAAAFL